MMPSQCTVVRDGAEERVDAAELVPGDLVRRALLCQLLLQQQCEVQPRGATADADDVHGVSA